MDDLFSIGELAKYQNLSKQTLIYYDRIGLFRPAYVDPDNGYRYYSSAQIDRLDTILIMKKIGFSLKEIREYMKDYTIDTSLTVLRKQLTVIDRQIGELSMIRSRLLHRCVQMENARNYMEAEATVVTEAVREQYLLVRNVEEPYRMREISIATKRCFAEAFQKHLPVYFQSGVTVPLQRIREGRYTEASAAFLPIEKTEDVQNLHRMPAGTCVCTYHIGDYLSIGRSYDRLLEYCDSHGLKILSDSYEFCINDYLTTDDENEYITKILFYVPPVRESARTPSGQKT